MNPNMLSRLTVIPSPGINKKAPKNVNGSPAAVQTARRVESVKKSTRKMSPRPDSPFRTMRSRRPWKSSDAKYQGVTRIPSGSRIARMTSRAPAVVSASRPPSCSSTLRNTAGSPFIEASRSDAAKPSVTAAMSARRTTPPSAAVMTGIRPKSSAVAAAPSVRRVSSWAPLRAVPAGMSAEPSRTAAATPSKVNPNRVRFRSGTSMVSS